MKNIALLIALCIALCCTGCTFSGSKNYTSTTNSRLIEIANTTDLYYDANTKVVYIIFNEFTGDAGYGYMSPYYADNGLPYLYNTETNSLEENSWTKLSGFESWLNH